MGRIRKRVSFLSRNAVVQPELRRALGADPGRCCFAKICREPARRGVAVGVAVPTYHVLACEGIEAVFGTQDRCRADTKLCSGTEQDISLLPAKRPSHMRPLVTSRSKHSRKYLKHSTTSRTRSRPGDLKCAEPLGGCPEDPHPRIESGAGSNPLLCRLGRLRPKSVSVFRVTNPSRSPPSRPGACPSPLSAHSLYVPEALDLPPDSERRRPCRESRVWSPMSPTIGRSSRPCSCAQSRTKVALREPASARQGVEPAFRRVPMRPTRT